jgi:hypothetical protein
MMPEKKKETSPSAKRSSAKSADWLASWGAELQSAACELCNWSFLLPPVESMPICPHCFGGELERVEDSSALPHGRPPELTAPFSLSKERLQQNLQAFARTIPFAPGDLTTQNLEARLQRVLIPMWLVDAEVGAAWQCEIGFDYDVVSFEDRFSDRQGGWSSERVTETRIRWEPRMGRLRRMYDNVAAPALEEHAGITDKLGEFELASAQDYQASSLEGAYVRLPNRPPEDAWPDAVPVLRALAAEECRRAAEAEHQRDFRWSPKFAKQNWTQVLLPAYTSHYLDDDLKPQPLIIHGQTGKVNGAKRASLKRASMTSVVIAAVAGLLGLPSLVLSVFPILPLEIRSLAGCGVMLGLLLGITAVIPFTVASLFNRRHDATQRA